MKSVNIAFVVVVLIHFWGSPVLPSKTVNFEPCECNNKTSYVPVNTTKTDKT